jgi:hypothetical protein
MKQPQRHIPLKLFASRSLTNRSRQHEARSSPPWASYLTIHLDLIVHPSPGPSFKLVYLSLSHTHSEPYAHKYPTNPRVNMQYLNRYKFEKTFTREFYELVTGGGTSGSKDKLESDNKYLKWCGEQALASNAVLQSVNKGQNALMRGRWVICGGTCNADGTYTIVICWEEILEA